MSPHNLKEISLGESQNEILFYIPLNIQIVLLSLEKFCSSWHISKNTLLTKISKLNLLKKVIRLFISLTLILHVFPFIFFILTSRENIDFQTSTIIIYAFFMTFIYAFIYRKEQSLIPYLKFTEYQSGTLLLISIKNNKNKTLISKDNLYRLLMYLNSTENPIIPVESVYISRGK